MAFQQPLDLLICFICPLDSPLQMWADVLCTESPSVWVMPHIFSATCGELCRELGTSDVLGFGSATFFYHSSARTAIALFQESLLTKRWLTDGYLVSDA